MEALRHSRQYQRSVAELIVMICPFAPMFASELWSGLATVADKMSQFDWVRLLPTLKYRRLRGDMIDVFKIINNMYGIVSVPVLPFAPTSSATRGNSFKLLNQRFYHDIRKYSFLPRIINTWNSLPDFVVNVDSVIDWILFGPIRKLSLAILLILSESEIDLSF